MIKRKLAPLTLLFLFLFAGNQELKATHLMGGEITWECNGTGQYIFSFSIYRDCSGSPLDPEGRGDLYIHNYPTVGQRTLITENSSQIGLPGNWGNTGVNQAIEPPCRGGAQINCASGDLEAVFEYLRVTSPVTLVGNPPAEGWIITYDDAARNATDNLPAVAITLRAKILPHSGTVAGQCIDNSPKFTEKPTSLLCNNQTFTYNHNATDDEYEKISGQLL